MCVLSIVGLSGIGAFEAPAAGQQPSNQNRSRHLCGGQGTNATRFEQQHHNPAPGRILLEPARLG